MKHAVLRRLPFVLAPKGGNSRLWLLAGALISTCWLMPARVCAQPSGAPAWGAGTPTAAAQSGRSFAPDHIEVNRETGTFANTLKGVDTIVVEIDRWPSPQELPLQGDVVYPILTDAVRSVFTDAAKRIPLNQIRVIPRLTGNKPLDLDLLKQPNVIRIHFSVSAREQSLDGKTVNVASMAWAIGKYGSSDGWERTQGSAYPFLVTRDKEEQLQLLRDGVTHSLASLPNYFSCAEKRGQPSAICPDCNVNVCKNEHLPPLVQP